MKIQSIILFYFLLNNTTLSAQTSPSISPVIQGSEMVREISSLEKNKVLGDVYLDANWLPISVILYEGDKFLDGYLGRYDIEKNEFEFRKQNDAKLLAGERVKSITWIDDTQGVARKLINAKGFSLNGIPILGFFEILLEGTTPLFKKTYIEIIKPSYILALGVGNQETLIQKTAKYYFALNNNELYLLKNKKSLAPLESPASPRVSLYAKKESIRFNKEEDLKRLFFYINNCRP